MWLLMVSCANQSSQIEQILELSNVIQIEVWFTMFFFT